MSKIYEALMGRRRFPSYRRLLDRTDDGEDTEVAIAVQDDGDHDHGNLQHTILELVRQLEQTPYDVCGSTFFAQWQKLARFVAKRTTKDLAFSIKLAKELSLSFGLYHDSSDATDDSSLCHVLLREAEQDVLFVNQLDLLQVLVHGLAVQPSEVADSLANFLDYFGSACDLEHAMAPADASLIDLEDAAPTDLVLAHRDSAFYKYASNLLPRGFLVEPQRNAAIKALQAFALPNAVAHVLTAPRHRAVDAATYEVFPLWPYFAWKALMSKK